MLLKNNVSKSNKPSIEQSIHILLNKENYTNRRELYFKNAVKINEISIQKKRLKYLSMPGYKVALASETPIDSFGINLAKEIRVKLRESYILDDLKDWRLDIVLDSSNDSRTRV